MYIETLKSTILQCESIEEIDKLIEKRFNTNLLKDKVELITAIFDVNILGKPKSKYDQTDYEIILHTILHGGAF